MGYPEFRKLPFNKRPDLSPYLIHLTKSTFEEDGHDAFDNLVHILETGKIWGSSNKGFIKGSDKAACFMDVPLSSLKYIVTKENKFRYSPYGVIIGKPYAYDLGARPVLYLSLQEQKKLCISENELWRVVRFEVMTDGWISWMHEREWRKKGTFILPKQPVGVFVKTLAEAKKLNTMLIKEKERFKVKPRSVLPLGLISQGLIY